jgi:vacuolar protein sorting-associated protein 52
MWLDRLSSHSTPTGSPPLSSNRSFSPSSRRASHLAPSAAPQRPGFAKRSSSLSLPSNDSTASLPTTSRHHASGLKQSTTVSDAPDPLFILERLLGPEGKGGTSKAINGADPTEESEFGMDLEGLSLREVLAQDTTFSEPELVYNTQTIEECMYHPTNTPVVVVDLQQ